MFQRHRSIGVPRFLVTVAIACMAMPGHGQQASIEFDGPGYRVQLPNSITGVTKPGPDFDVSTFTKVDGSVLLGAYAGLHPNFNERGSRADRVNGLNAKRLEWTNSEKQKCAEVLVTIRGSRQLTFSVHFWYCLAADADVKQAESIIRSIRPEP
jgi:hypothetical protein